MNEPFLRLLTDKWFRDSPYDGEPECICSRCLEVIEEEDSPSIRVFDTELNLERRYHPKCVGISFEDGIIYDDFEFNNESTEAEERSRKEKAVSEASGTKLSSDDIYRILGIDPQRIRERIAGGNGAG